MKENNWERLRRNERSEGGFVSGADGKRCEKAGKKHRLVSYSSQDS